MELMYTKEFQLRKTSEEASANELLNSIASELKKHKPRSIDQKESSVHFSAGVFRLVFNWNILVPITSGTIKFKEGEPSLVYTLSFKELMIFGVVATIFIVAVPLASGAPLAILFVAPILVWGWLVGMNFILSISRFGSLIKKCIKGSFYEIIK